MNLPEPLPRWISARGEAIFDTEKRVIGLRGTAQDITERIHAQKLLAASEQRLKLALDAAKLGRFEMDLRTCHATWDRNHEQLFGLVPGSWDGNYEAFRDAVHPDDAARLSAAVREARESRGVFSEEFRVVWPDGSHRWLMSRGAFVYDGDDEPSRVIGMSLDITERRNAEAALRNSEDRLQQAIRASGIGVFDHDHMTGSVEWAPGHVETPAWIPDFPISVEGHFDARHLQDIHFADRDRVAAALRKAYDPAQDGVFDEEFRLPGEGGTGDGGLVRWVRMQSKTLFADAANGHRAVRTIGTIRDITEQKQASEELKKLATLVEMSHDFIGIATVEGRCVYLNEAAKTLVGLTGEDVTTKEIIDFLAPSTAEQTLNTMLSSILRDGYWAGTSRLRHFKTGAPIDVEITAFDIPAGSGAPRYVATVTRDLTASKAAEGERLRLEAQLFQAQKLEAVGQLAGGVAHDFNNMLTVILGYSYLLRGSLAADSLPLRQLTEIEKAANRSRELTQKLLGFSRRQIIAPVPSDLNHLVADLKEPLARLMGEDIEFTFHPRTGLWAVEVDPGQVNQILLNLVVNARDAMPRGGKLTIETSNTTVTEEYCKCQPGATPGAYVLLAVSDTGIGIDAETIMHIFEPFFTTKERLKGTGLGLATVYGIVKQNGGFINVYSELAHGTTFKIYFPRLSADIAAMATEPEPEPGVPPAGRGNILLVEDDELVRTMTADVLASLGYKPLLAATPKEALLICAKADVPIHLLLTDVVMPGMNGLELREQVLLVRPGTKVLFMSGYTSNVIVHHGVLKKGVHFIQKPFGINDLGRRIEEVMATEETQMKAGN